MLLYTITAVILICKLLLSSTENGLKPKPLCYNFNIARNIVLTKFETIYPEKCVCDNKAVETICSMCYSSKSKKKCVFYVIQILPSFWETHYNYFYHIRIYKKLCSILVCLRCCSRRFWSWFICFVLNTKSSH